MTEISPSILWAIVGVGLIIAELFTSSFVLIFFGLSALLVSGMVFLGLVDFVMQMFIFSIFSLSSLLLFRKKIMGRFVANSHTVMDEKQILVLDKKILAGESAQITYQGTTWTALNKTEQDFFQGDKVVIEKIEGVKIILSRQ